MSTAAADRRRLSPARGPAGKVRNFKQMKTKKLEGVYQQVMERAPDDTEAVTRITAEMKARGLALNADTGSWEPFDFEEF